MLRSMRVVLHRLLVLLPVLALGSANASVQSKPGRPAPILATALLDLGETAAGAKVRATAWVVNPLTTPVRVTSVRSNCACLEVDGFRPTTLAPGAVKGWDILIESDVQPGAKREKAIEFLTDTGGWARVRVRVATSSSPLDVPSSDRIIHPPVVALSPIMDLGTVAPDTAVSQDVWLINTTSAPVEITAVKASCACIRMAEVIPGTITPGKAMRIPMTMGASREPGTVLERSVVFNGPGRPVRVAVKIATAG